MNKYSLRLKRLETLVNKKYEPELAEGEIIIVDELNSEVAEQKICEREKEIGKKVNRESMLLITVTGFNR